MNGMKKLNLGCGEDFKKGWVNVDFNKSVKADIYADMNKRMPFNDNEFDRILADNVIEHTKDFYKVMSELCRILKKGGTIEIYVPHYTSPNALKLPYHTYYFGIGSFDFSKYTAGMDKLYSIDLEMVEERLSLFQRKYHQSRTIDSIAQFMNRFNFMFNLSRTWKLLCERVWIFGFDEMKVILRKR